VSPEVITFVLYIIWILINGLVLWVFMALLGPKDTKDPEKFTPWESGLPLLDKTRRAVNARYYIVALMFVLFEIETLYLLPWALIYRKLGIVGIIEMFIFIFVLIIGLVYIWKKGIFTWGLKQKSYNS
jgi:NADH-quinone oxidoreductase subunit A